MLLLACMCAPGTGSAVDSAPRDTFPPAEGAEGTLVMEQLHLSGWSIGESLLIVGPDGTTVLVDLGNDSHDDEVLAALDALGERAVDWVLLTHFHEDHVGGFDKLFDDAGVEVREAVVHRGPFDLDPSDTNAGSWEEVCSAGLETVELCDGPDRAPCDIGGAGAPWPASSCEGLTIDLGGGAELEVVAVNGFAGGQELALPDDDENARSLVAHLRFGDFDAVVGGDLTGGFEGTPDVEGFVASAVTWPSEGMDLLVLDHHGIDSSTNEAWVAAMLPGEVDRQVLVAANHIYLGAPAQDVLDRIAGRVGGGAVWVTEEGSLAGDHDRLCEAEGSVRVVVTDGAGYRVEVADGTGTCPGGSFRALIPE